MKRALVVIDVQNEYVSGRLPITFPEVDSAIRHVAQAMDAAAERSIPVIVVQHGAPEDSPVFAQGSTGFDLVPTVASRPSTLRFEKRLPSSFTDTPLDQFLHDSEIDTIVIAGFMTQLCCESTARDAVHRGFQVEFLSDATGTLALSNDVGALTAEQVHTGVLVVLHSEFAAVMPTDAWVASLDSGVRVVGSDLLESTVDPAVAPA